MIDDSIGLAINLFFLTQCIGTKTVQGTLQLNPKAGSSCVWNVENRISVFYYIIYYIIVLSIFLTFNNHCLFISTSYHNFFFLMLNNWLCFTFHFRGQLRGEEPHWPRFQEGADRLHQRPTGGTGEGIPLQPLPVSPPPGGDGQPAEPNRAPDQDLVPEPKNEVQEGPESQGDHAQSRGSVSRPQSAIEWLQPYRIFKSTAHSQ